MGLSSFDTPDLSNLCENKVTMAKRQCLECGGELVMAFRPSENSGPGAGSLMRPNAKWRCSTCGHAFTAEQLRAEKRASAKMVEPTPSNERSS
jgi:ribosomal protein S27AE